MSFKEDPIWRSTQPAILIVAGPDRIIVAEQRLLVASHIVPWKDDKANRLNPRNGLCLSMLHDKAFDAGMITLNEDLTVRVSRNYCREGDVFFVDALLGYEGKVIAVPEKFRPDEEFLAFHRERVFEGA